MKENLAFFDEKSSYGLYMLVYTGENLIYTSPILTEKSKPQSFEIPINHANFIKILVATADVNVGNAGALIMSDVKLFK